MSPDNLNSLSTLIGNLQQRPQVQHQSVRAQPQLILLLTRERHFICLDSSTITDTVHTHTQSCPSRLLASLQPTTLTGYTLMSLTTAEYMREKLHLSVTLNYSFDLCLKIHCALFNRVILFFFINTNLYYRCTFTFIPQYRLIYIFYKIGFSEYIKLLSHYKITQSTSLKNKRLPQLCCENLHFLSRQHRDSLDLCTSTKFSLQTYIICMAFLYAGSHCE